MKINWIFLPDKLDSYLDLSLKKLKKTKKQMKNLKKKRSVKSKKSLDIYTSYSIPETLKILKYFKLRYNKLVQIPKKYKSKKLIEEFLRKHRISNSTTVFTKFSFFEQRGGSGLSFGRTLSSPAGRAEIRTILGGKKGSNLIEINNTNNLNNNMPNNIKRINQKLNDMLKKLNIINDQLSIIENDKNEIIVRFQTLFSNSQSKESNKISFTPQFTPDFMTEGKLVSGQNNEPEKTNIYKYIGKKIEEFKTQNKDLKKSSEELQQLFDKQDNSENKTKSIEDNTKAILDYLIGKIWDKISNLSNLSVKNLNSEPKDSVVQYMNLYIQLTSIASYVAYGGQEKDMPREYENLKILINQEALALENKQTLETEIEVLQNKKNKIKAKNTKTPAKNEESKRDTCFSSIERMWFNIYDKPSVEGTMNKFDNKNDNRRYQTHNQKILDFYNILHNCKPFKETLVAGVLIASPLSNKSSESTVPAINKII